MRVVVLSVSVRCVTVRVIPQMWHATAADDANPAAGQPRLIPAKPGRPSNDVREACRKGAEEFFKLVEYIANTYGYSESQIFDMMQIGPRPKEVRASDDHSWNAWVSYFYLMHPLEKGGNAGMSLTYLSIAFH